MVGAREIGSQPRQIWREDVAAAAGFSWQLLEALGSFKVWNGWPWDHGIPYLCFASPNLNAPDGYQRTATSDFLDLLENSPEPTSTCAYLDPKPAGWAPWKGYARRSGLGIKVNIPADDGNPRVELGRSRADSTSSSDPGTNEADSNDDACTVVVGVADRSQLPRQSKKERQKMKSQRSNERKAKAAMVLLNEAFCLTDDMYSNRLR